MNREAPRVIIVGAGFGGTYAAHALRNAPVRATVVDRTNHSLFTPLLYQVATCALSADKISSPIRFLLRRHRNAEVLMAEVTDVDLAARTVAMGDRRLAYDYLVIATGTRYNYFGHDDWPRFAPGLKSVADAERIRDRLLRAFEQAELENDPEQVRAQLTFVLVGAGPTGVELAGALAELARSTLRREYRRVDTRGTRIILLEAGPQILPGFDQRLADKAKAELERKGVHVQTDATVTGIDEQGVTIKRGSRIASTNVVWTAGVYGTALAGSLDVETDRRGRVKVRPDLSIPGHPEVFVIGDVMVLECDGQLFSPGLAPMAMQQGSYVGELIARRVSGQKDLPPFHYRDKGNLATVGRSFAVADFGRLKFAGFIAWVLWGAVHVVYLAGLWNRLQVLSTWAWAYLTSQRSVRILTPQSAELAMASSGALSRSEQAQDPDNPPPSEPAAS